MKKLVVLAVVSALGSTSGVALARPYGDPVRVIESRPLYEQAAVPAQQCWTQPVTTYETRHVGAQAPRPVYVNEGPTGAGAVVGAIIGGVVGHQFGNSRRGRSHATAAGAILGGLLGNHIEGESARGGYYTQGEAPAAHLERVPVTHLVQRCRYVSHGPGPVTPVYVRGF